MVTGFNPYADNFSCFSGNQTSQQSKMSEINSLNQGNETQNRIKLMFIAIYDMLLKTTQQKMENFPSSLTFNPRNNMLLSSTMIVNYLTKQLYRINLKKHSNEH